MADDGLGMGVFLHRIDVVVEVLAFFFSSRRRHTRLQGDWSSDVCSSDLKVDFVGIGASYDPGKWFAMAEWARFDTHSILGARTAWYASGGYRFGKITPYATDRKSVV